MRILHIMGKADIGGIISLVYTYMMHIDQKRYHFDLALTGNEPGYLGHKMMECGSQVYKLPLKSQGVREFERQLDSLLKREHFDAIHVHHNSTSWVALRVAMRNGIKCRIAHAHTALRPTTRRGHIRLLSGQVLNFVYATKLMACGREAGNVLFGKLQMHARKAMILPNAIDANAFRYSSLNRDSMREELGIGNRYAIGMVGRIVPDKNHRFAFEVMSRLRELHDDSVLVVVGDGPMLPHLRTYCHQRNLSDNVLFTGRRTDMARVYSALDAYIMPSLYEGLPVAAVEALTSGLPTLLSANITQELGFSQNTTYLPLESATWVDSLRHKPVGVNREHAYLEIIDNGYDINSSAKLLTDVYDTALN